MPSYPLTVRLNEPAARLPAVAGGKGSSLARMTSNGLPVPDGFVITTEAYTQVASSVPKDTLDRIGSADPGDLAELEGLCLAVRRVFLDAGVPDSIASAVETAYTQLGEHLAVSVRSSGTAEDLASASFAGQYETFLNVTGSEAMLEALTKVWASLYSTHAIAYRLRLGMTIQSEAMAVVVQRQIEPTAAGVMFTRHPITDSEDRYLINVSFGLGEGVVSGQAPSDTFEIDRDSMRVVSQTIAQKDTMLAPAEAGGIESVNVPATRQMEPALSDGQLTDLASFGSRLVELNRAPQDIEFAVDGGQVYLLQSRPVTTGSGTVPFSVEWEDPRDEEHLWNRSEGPLKRLEEEAVRVYTEGMKVCFLDTGAPFARNHDLRFINGFSFTRLVDADEDEIGKRQEEHRDRDQTLIEQGTSIYQSEIEPRVKAAIRDLESFQPARASLADLYDHLRMALKSYGEVMGDLHWRMAAGARIDWPAVYAEITGEPPIESAVLMQARPNSITRLVSRLRGLARAVQQDPGLSAVFQNREYEKLGSTELRTSPAVSRFRARFRRLLRDFGHRTGSGYGSDAGYLDSTWNMKPEQVMDMVRSYALQDLDRLDKIEADARANRKRAERRVERKLAGDPEKLVRFKKELVAAVRWTARMEDHNHIMEQGVNGVFREAVHMMGSGLVRSTLLDGPDDVFHLTLDELGTLAQRGDIGDIRALVTDRKAELEQRRKMRPPDTLGMGEAVHDEHSALYDMPDDTGLIGNVLKGVGSSPGRVEGRAKVAQGGVAPPTVQQGDILVAPNAGPAWTPIFPLLGGMVLDAGAVFQHASLVAREYGIPAVIMTRDATTVIVDGQRLRLDAAAGTVELLP